jgi:MoaA/NifB/PqqE/SkfB family radical SAM enzyme
MIFTEPVMASKFLTSYLPELSASIFGRTKPAMVTVNLTNQCNQNCIYCEIGQNHTSPGQEALSFDDIIWILDEMAKNRINKISLCGGEPFLFKGIIDVAAYAGKMKIRCAITTNGMTIHQLSEAELSILKESKTEINISVDSFRDDIQSYTRGAPSALKNALKSIKKLTEKNIPVTALTVISKYNYRDLYKSFTTAYEKGIRQVLFQPVIYYSNYPERSAIDHKSQLSVSPDHLEVLMEELRKILKFEKNHHIITNVYRIYPWIGYFLKTAENQNGDWFFDKVLNKFFCRDVFAIIDISYDGGIQPCPLTKASFSIHQNREKGLGEIWRQATLEIRNDMINGRYYAVCNGCCNHFSRNMLASIIRYPLRNRAALNKIVPLVFSRVQSRLIKSLI